MSYESKAFPRLQHWLDSQPEALDAIRSLLGGFGRQVGTCALSREVELLAVDEAPTSEVVTE